MKRCQDWYKKESLNTEIDFWRAYRWMEEKGIFPEYGSFLDQSAQFVFACEFMRAYAAAHKKMKQDSADRISAIKKRNGKKR